ncbi:MAG: hypothetical protein GY778_01410 [bacterium]|nr:hypothetical protein [bacterium]
MKGTFRAARGGGRHVSGAVAVGDSKEANAMQLTLNSTELDVDVAVQDDLAFRDEAGRLVHAVQQVNNRASYNDGDVWIDSAYLDGTSTQRIALFSEEYFALARSDRRAARYLAQGPRVIFVLEGVAYETVTD